MVQAIPASNTDAKRAHAIMSDATVQSNGGPRAVRAWLYAVAALVFAMIVVGGATPLTQSGPSIVEWQPVPGILPPMSEAAWQTEFEKYQTIPQYRELNRGMTLGEFKTIYWWEWSHRLLGRVVGAAFLLPFLWFLWRGSIRPGLRARLWAIFALGALQGAIGWWMVASGLAERLSVSQYRLAFHLTLACAIYAMVLWAAQSLQAQDRLPRTVVAAPSRLRVSATSLLALVLCQIYLGALVAGLNAGRIYNTWPLIDGGLVPDASRLWFETPLWRNFFENTLTVQFDHRLAAYLLWGFAVFHAIDAGRAGSGPVARAAIAFAIAITLQAALGIWTLLDAAPLALALSHQAMAMVALTIA